MSAASFCVLCRENWRKSKAIRENGRLGEWETSFRRRRSIKTFLLNCVRMGAPVLSRETNNKPFAFCLECAAVSPILLTSPSSLIAFDLLPDLPDCLLRASLPAFDRPLSGTFVEVTPTRH